MQITPKGLELVNGKMPFFYPWDLIVERMDLEAVWSSDVENEKGELFHSLVTKVSCQRYKPSNRFELVLKEHVWGTEKGVIHTIILTPSYNLVCDTVTPWF